MKRPLVFTAMKQEAAAIAKALGNARDGLDLEVIGIRACRLPADLSRRAPSCIIMAGLAGALDPALAVGDIVTGDAIHTSDQLVTTAADKAKLFRETGRRAVDMENAIVRAAAISAAIPFTAIRAISDAADTAIDPEVLALVDEMGSVRPLAVAGLLLRRPAMMTELRRLQADSAKALSALGSAVRQQLEIA